MRIPALGDDQVDSLAIGVEARIPRKRMARSRDDDEALDPEFYHLKPVRNGRERSDCEIERPGTEINEGALPGLFRRFAGRRK